MKKIKNKHNSQAFDYGQIIDRINTIIKLLMFMIFSDAKGNLKIKDSARFLYKEGWEPKEIARFLGKGSASKLSYVLYSKNKGKKHVAKGK